MWDRPDRHMRPSRRRRRRAAGDRIGEPSGLLPARDPARAGVPDPDDGTVRAVRPRRRPPIRDTWIHRPPLLESPTCAAGPYIPTVPTGRPSMDRPAGPRWV